LVREDVVCVVFLTGMMMEEESEIVEEDGIEY
jgi:hypothetical protein